MSTEFIILNDIQQYIKEKLPNGPWIHHATIRRRNKIYIAFRQAITNKIYIEQIEKDIININKNTLKQIEDDREWEEIISFCRAAGLLRIKIDEEIKIAT